MNNILLSGTNVKKIKALTITYIVILIFVLPAIYVSFYIKYSLDINIDGKWNIDILNNPSDQYFLITLLTVQLLGLILRFICLRIGIFGGKNEKK